MDPVIAEEVIEWLYEGGALLEFCRLPGKPKKSTIYRWQEDDPEFAGRFARARVAGAATWVEEGAEIVRNATPETVQVAKLQAEFCLKRAACFAPQHFGTKVAIGGDPNGVPVKFEHKGPPVPATADLLAGIVALNALATELLQDEGKTT